MEISIIGAGRLGGALAIALAKNHTIRQIVAHRRDVSQIAAIISPPPEILSFDELEKVSADAVFITTPDSEIQTVAKLLAKKTSGKPFVFHTSGALSSEVLRSLKNVGCAVGSLHPLVSVSDSVGGAGNFKDAYFCVEGEPSAVKIAERIVVDLEGKFFTISSEFKSLYHASAVMASGHLVAVFSVAIELLTVCGVPERDAQKILLPLVASTLKNLVSQSPAQALTGPFARADVETIERHLAALDENVAVETSQIYRQLGLQALRLAERQGAKKENLTKIENLLLNSQQSTPNE